MRDDMRAHKVVRVWSNDYETEGDEPSEKLLSDYPLEEATYYAECRWKNEQDFEDIRVNVRLANGALKEYIVTVKFTPLFVAQEVKKDRKEP